MFTAIFFWISMVVAATLAIAMLRRETKDDDYYYSKAYRFWWGVFFIFVAISVSGLIALIFGVMVGEISTN